MTCVLAWKAGDPRFRVDKGGGRREGIFRFGDPTVSGPPPHPVDFDMKKSLFSLLAFFSLAIAAPASAEEVYLFRGGFDIFSTGMNQMANELRAKKVKASSQSFMSWQSVANDIVKRSKTKKVSYPIILLGHSFGADAVTEFANFLGQNGISTELVIAFDATGTRTLTKGAKKVINYRSSQIGLFVKGPGFRGSLSHIDVSKYGANHFTIEQVKEVQALAMKEVLAKVGRRR